ncbi:MAG: hypothetical protein LBO07_00550 [Coriobacteriales bacterium]|nr:hypothetical protein [Coriobacteriales bacterium]
MEQNFEDFKYFLNNRTELIKRYGDSFIVIKQGKVLGAYPSHQEAVDTTMRNEALGSFIVQECSRDGALQTMRVRHPVTVNP